MNRMRILIITKSVPWPLDQGSHIRNYHLIKHLSEQHEIYLISLQRSPLTADAMRQLKQYCQEIILIPAFRHIFSKACDLTRSVLTPVPYTVLACTNQHMSKIIRNKIKDWSIDIVQLEELYVALNAKPLKSNIPIILDAHNSEALILFRLAESSNSFLARVFYRSQARKMEAFEQRVIKEVHAVLSVSMTELTFFRDLNPNSHFLPNGIENVLPEQPSREQTILFTGHLAYPPNHNGLLWFLREVWLQITKEHPSLVLKVIARAPSNELRELGGPQVQFISDADDIEPFLLAARVQIVPLHAGGGTRLKILEAFASRLPVVSTTIGAEGLGVTNETHLLIGDSPTEFADAVLRVLKDPSLAQHLSEEASKHVNANFLWRDLVQNVQSVYSNLVE